MVNVMGADVSAEVPPPYMPPGVPGFVTVTDAVPAVITSASGIVVVSWLALTNLVVRAVPFQLMVAAGLLLKLVPLTVSTTPMLPAGVLAGERALMVGIDPAAGGVVLCEL